VNNGIFHDLNQKYGMVFVGIWKETCVRLQEELACPKKIHGKIKERTFHQRIMKKKEGSFGNILIHVANARTNEKPCFSEGTAEEKVCAGT
jgi:hypothetical protein